MSKIIKCLLYFTPARKVLVARRGAHDATKKEKEGEEEEEEEEEDEPTAVSRAA